MKRYQVKVSVAADRDLLQIQAFLLSVLSKRGAFRYVVTMMTELRTLASYADLFHTSRYADIRAIHPKARRMVSHNKRWTYVFHIEDDTVVVDRILPSKMIKW